MIINFSNIGSGSGSGGVTTGDVQTMIDASISGKADTSAVTEAVEDKQTLFTGNTLSAITGMNEGDVAVIISGSTGETVVHLTGEQLNGLFSNGGWVAGTTYKISADTATATPYRTQLAGTFTTTNGNLRLQFGYKEGETTSGYYTNILTTDNTKTDWDGSEITFTIPEYTEWALVQNYNGEGMVDLIDVYTTVSGTQTQTQYNRVNGEWVEPASKAYVNNVVGDIETLLSNI